MSDFPEFHHNRDDIPSPEKISILREDLEILFRHALYGLQHDLEIGAQLNATFIRKISESVGARAAQLSRFSNSGLIEKERGDG